MASGATVTYTCPAPTSGFTLTLKAKSDSATCSGSGSGEATISVSNNVVVNVAAQNVSVCESATGSVDVTFTLTSSAGTVSVDGAPTASNGAQCTTTNATTGRECCRRGLCARGAAACLHARACLQCPSGRVA